MSKIYIVVEGQCEQTFVRDILAPYYGNLNKFLFPVLIGKPGHKGGNVSIERMESDITKLFKSMPAIYVTTMIDFYKIDTQWPGYSQLNLSCNNGSCQTSILKTEFIQHETDKYFFDKLSNVSNIDKRFFSYFNIYEFEALLFSDSQILSSKIGTYKKNIDSILTSYDNNPESINNHQPPSYRIMNFKENYKKVKDGCSIAKSISINSIRKQCKNFNNWLYKIEQLPG